MIGSGELAGCFECLLDHGDHPGIKASLAESDQDFAVSFSGCAGTFTPYGELDADRAALEATRVAIGLLRGGEPESVLVSWMEDPSAFDERYKRSARGKTFSVGERRRETRFIDPSCTVCGR